MGNTFRSLASKGMGSNIPRGASNKKSLNTFYNWYAEEIQEDNHDRSKYNTTTGNEFWRDKIKEMQQDEKSKDKFSNQGVLNEIDMDLMRIGYKAKDLKTLTHGDKIQILKEKNAWKGE